MLFLICQTSWIAPRVIGYDACHESVLQGLIALCRSLRFPLCFTSQSMIATLAVTGWPLASSRLLSSSSLGMVPRCNNAVLTIWYGTSPIYRQYIVSEKKKRERGDPSFVEGRELDVAWWQHDLTISFGRPVRGSVSGQHG